MLHILDVLAVREAVALQPPIRRRICRMLMAGYTREEIAEELGCEITTVHTHIARIRRSFIKLGFCIAPSRASAAGRRRGEMPRLRSA